MKSLKTFGNLVKRAVPAAVLLLVVIYFGVSITAANRTIAYFKLNNFIISVYYDCYDKIHDGK